MIVHQNFVYGIHARINEPFSKSLLQHFGNNLLYGLGTFGSYHSSPSLCIDKKRFIPLCPQKVSTFSFFGNFSVCFTSDSLCQIKVCYCRTSFWTTAIPEIFLIKLLQPFRQGASRYTKKFQQVVFIQSKRPSVTIRPFLSSLKNKYVLFSEPY